MSHQSGRRRVTADIDAVDDRACGVLHVDMDAFFAAVELLRRPDLRGTPMMVAGRSARGVVLSATYEARAYGVRSAMPTAQALARCPGITVLPPDHAQYTRLSRQVMAIFDDVTSMVERVSVDEAYLDVTGVRQTGGRPASIGVSIRRRILAELGLVATVGVAPNKFLAKLASTLAKPDGLLVVPPDQVTALLRPLAARAIPGVGPRTAERLAAAGLDTVGDLADAPRGMLERLLGRARARTVHELSHGRDPSKVVPHSAEASIGAEETFADDLVDPDAVARALLDLSRTAGRRLRRAGRAGHTIVLKVRFADFTTVTRSERIETPVHRDRDLATAAMRAWRRLGSGRRPIRLLGVRIESLTRVETVTEQLELGVDEERPGWREAQATLDAIADRFPAAAPRPATLVMPPEGGRRSSDRPPRRT